MFTVQGQVYHRIGSMLPLPDEESQFLQIYFMGDAQVEAERRHCAMADLKLDIMLPIQEMLHRTNSFVTTFETALERWACTRTLHHAVEHSRRFIALAVDEVAILIVGQDLNKRDIALQKQDNQLYWVSDTHCSYNALQYPLLFCHGEDGYNFEQHQFNPSTGQTTSEKVSAMDFYGHRIMKRSQDFNRLLRSKAFFHQSLVDMYAKIESERLMYIWFNQNKLRVDSYISTRETLLHKTAMQLS